MNKAEYLSNLKHEVKHLRNLFNYAHAGLLVNYAPNTADETKALVDTCRTCQRLQKDIDQLLEDLRLLDQSISLPYYY